MKQSSPAEELLPGGPALNGYIFTIYFDMKCKKIGDGWEQTHIIPSAPNDWESENCFLIPSVKYVYILVSKTNLQTQAAIDARFARAKEQVKRLDKIVKEKGPGSSLRVVRNTIVFKMQPDVEDAVFKVELHDLVDSYGKWTTDRIVMQRISGDIPPHLKDLFTAKSG